MLEDYPQGLAAPDAGGLDDDPSWGRTYYGGAIFCLRADIEIRRRSDNTRSLQDAMRGVAAAGGNISAMWPLEDVLRIADAATGSTVFAELYASMRDVPEPGELQSLWRGLGVRLDGERVVFDDTAPLAAVRRALVLGR
jgi:predicted metalloprotease with PDZ domain